MNRTTALVTGEVARGDDYADLDDGPGQPDDCIKSSKITGSTLKRALTRQ